MRMPMVQGLVRRAAWLASRLGRRPASEAAPQPPVHPWEKAYPRGLDWRAHIAVRPATALLADAAAAYPENVCINFRGRRHGYAEVEALVARAAKGLQDLGVRKGIKVGLMLPNCPYAVIFFHAVLRAGGTVVQVNPLYARREIERQVRDAGIRIMVTLDMRALYPKVAPCLDEAGLLERIVVCPMAGVLPFHEKAVFRLLKRRQLASIPRDDSHLRYDDFMANDGDFSPVAVDPATDVAVLQYTGGTTGLPKGAELTHANLYTNARQVAMWATAATPGAEKILGVLPLFHSFGMTAVMNVGMVLGAELVLLPHFKPVEVLRAIDRQRPTFFVGVPTMFSALNAYRDLASYDLSSLKFCISGGAPLPGEVQRTFEALTGCPLVEGYGLSEAAPVCTVNPFTGVNKAGSVGLPMPGTVIEIVALDDADRVLGPGETGEICITGPQVMPGYANRAAETADVLAHGRLRTGDVGYLDEDGYLFIVDRIKELILSGGFNVYPRMVEEAIYLHPAVQEGAVVGLPDEHRGEVVTAFVTLGPGERLEGRELRAFLKDELAPFKLPRRVHVVDELPKTMIGKIDKRRLIADAAGAEPRGEPVAAGGG